MADDPAGCDAKQGKANAAFDEDERDEVEALEDDDRMSSVDILLWCEVRVSHTDSLFATPHDGHTGAEEQDLLLNEYTLMVDKCR